MSNTRARHRAETSAWLTISKAALGRGRTIGGTAAAVAAGSGLMLGMAAPAQAGVVANDSYTPAPAAAPAAPVAAAPAPAAETVAAEAAPAGTHTVVAGDTLGQIAATYGVSLDSIFSLNGLGMESIIYPGDVITYAGEATAAPAAVEYTAASYTETYAAPAAAAAPTDLGTFSTQSVDVTPAPAAAAATATNQIILNSAYAQMGAVQDCTVLVEVALRAAGHSVGDLAPAQLAAYGTPVSDPQPGDLIYYADGGMGFAHIAIYIGDGQAIHSGWNGNQTVINSANVGSGAAYYRVA
ncbi:NlpC/P60 family protein [Arthrobacter saudimassiliensis]|uniref:NlpC/P60 family protein n=1 Tax=Arthrobacter saudimassiliensis TaxID=1461584 RepID=A0A078MKZ7_9MICC|nr:NlpC/P60 family protein [Arthrobacter saudimassiliensis]